MKVEEQLVKDRRGKRYMKLDRAPMDVKKFIVNSHLEGKSIRQIRRELKARYKYNANERTISDWIKERTNIMRSFILDSPEYMARLQYECYEILRDMRKLNSKTWKLIDELEEHGEIRNRLLAFQEIRAQIELANKLLGILPVERKQEKGLDLKGLGVKIAKRLDEIKEKGKIEISQDTIKQRISITDGDQNKDVIEVRPVS